MAYETVEHNGRKNLRWIPDGAVKVMDKNNLGVAYVYAGRHTRKLVVAYAGQAAKPSFHYSVKDDAAAATYIREFFAGLAAHKKMVDERRERDNAGHTLKVGDIITNSWGYDQTNVDWYRIVRVSKVYVWLEEIGGTLVQATGPMAGMESVHIDVSGDDPAKWEPKGNGKISKHKAAGQSVTMKYGSGSKWDGRPLYSSWYA
jgi:hypothetical protein